MRTRIVAGVGAGLVALALGTLLASIAWQEPPPVRAPTAPATPVAAARPAGDRPAGERRLYCEFYNFVGRSPKVGFYFAPPAGGGTNYAQIFQQEADGAQTIFEPRPAWSYGRTEGTPTLRSPDGAIQINLYGDDPGNARRPGPDGWFEAGLRSVQYLNLDGQCRRTES